LSQSDLSDRQLLRYSRQLLLEDFGFAGQQALLRARVLIVGLGGLGCPAAMYLASSGVGCLVLADPDRVDLSNLQRQVAHTEADIGTSKVHSVRATLLALNRDVEVEALVSRLDDAQLADIVRGVDLVVDACDNFATRFALNRACVRHRVPLVHAAAVRFEAQLSVFDSRRPESPCYRCLYRDDRELDDSCASNGVIAPLVGMIGAAQALEAIKVLSGVGEPLVGRLLMLDGRLMQWHSLALPRRRDCPVCGA
jgi:molybdopterin/thiamine biosynthesis adenylyltransferase